MASRVGSYLSDNSIRSMCSENFPPSGSQTYGLFLTPNAPLGYETQRPQNPLKMMMMLSRLKNIPLDALRLQYQRSLGVVEPLQVKVAQAAQLRFPKPVSAVPTASRPQMIFVHPGATESEGGSAVGTAGAGLPSGLFYTWADSVFQATDQNAPLQRDIYHEVFSLAQTVAGVDFQGQYGGTVKMGWDAVGSGDEYTRKRMFNDLQKIIYSQMGADQAERFINEIVERVAGDVPPTAESVGAGSTALPPQQTAVPVEPLQAVSSTRLPSQAGTAGTSLSGAITQQRLPPTAEEAVKERQQEYTGGMY